MRTHLLLFFITFSLSCFAQDKNSKVVPDPICDQERMAYSLVIIKAGYYFKDDCYHASKRNYKIALKMIEKSKCFRTDALVQEDYRRVKETLKLVKKFSW